CDTAARNTVSRRDSHSITPGRARGLGAAEDGGGPSGLATECLRGAADVRGRSSALSPYLCIRALTVLRDSVRRRAVTVMFHPVAWSVASSSSRLRSVA